MASPPPSPRYRWAFGYHWSTSDTIWLATRLPSGLLHG